MSLDYFNWPINRCTLLNRTAPPYPCPRDQEGARQWIRDYTRQEILYLTGRDIDEPWPDRSTLPWPDDQK